MKRLFLPSWLYRESLVFCSRVANLCDLTSDVRGRNGSFDQALLETVCDWLDFQEASAGKWFRIEGGMKVLVQAMVDKVLSKPQTTIKYSTPVIALKNNDGNKTMSVTTEDGTTKEYDVVFNTTALACLQRMDIAQLGLPQKILTGIRSLHYDNSAKVAIKFKKAWWTGYLKSPGGVSASDLPISNIVYPSFDVADGEPAVLLASYAWSQDAIRLGSLFNNGQPGDKPNVDALIVTQVLKNIAEVWSKSGMENPPSYKDLRDMYIDHFAFSWDQDRYTGGAFALFGPGQFKDFYGPFQDPHCQGKFFICGEAISVEHAWISGALNSAYTATLKWVRQQDLKAKTKPDVTGQYKLKCSVFGGGEHQHPAEFNENILYWCVKLKDVVVEHDAATAPATAA